MVSNLHIRREGRRGGRPYRSRGYRVSGLLAYVLDLAGSAVQHSCVSPFFQGGEAKERTASGDACM